MKVATVLGARPQFVKAGPVCLALARGGHTEIILHTGQHYDDAMSKAFFDDLGLPPIAVNLGVGSGLHGAQTAAMIAGLEQALLQHRPDWVLVYGDTNSTAAGALAAAKLHLPLAHVEAGLRSFNRHMPEEINRVLTDSIADLLLAPTPTAVENLLAEGVHSDDIALSGDVMFDTVLQYSAQANARVGLLNELGVSVGRYALATIHRAENTDATERLSVVLSGLKRVAKHLPVVLPLHPRTKKLVEQNPDLCALAEHLFVIPPVGYFDMVVLERHAAVIATDSGGVQKEAVFHKVPCVTLRSETEWVETIEAGWNRLCPPSTPEGISDAILGAVGTRGRDLTAYGSGDAAERIVQLLERRVANPYRRAKWRAEVRAPV